MGAQKANHKSLEDASGQNSKQDGLKYDDDEIKDVIRAVSEMMPSNGIVDAAEIFAELQNYQLAMQFDHRLQLYIVLDVVFCNRMDAKALAENKVVVGKFVTSVNMTAAEVLWAFGAYFSAYPKVVERLPLILKVMYDEGWADETGILSYFNKGQGSGEPGFDEVKRAAAPFLKWLETAESDDNEDDSESIEGVDID